SYHARETKMNGQEILGCNDARSVAALKLDGKTDAIYFDDAMPGFGYRLRLGSGGKMMRSWIAQYKRAGATRRITLGWADVLGAEAARAAAKKILAKIALLAHRGRRVDGLLVEVQVHAACFEMLDRVE